MHSMDKSRDKEVGGVSKGSSCQYDVKSCFNDFQNGARCCKRRDCVKCTILKNFLIGLPRFGSTDTFIVVNS